VVLNHHFLLRVLHEGRRGLKEYGSNVEKRFQTAEDGTKENQFGLTRIHRK